MDTELHNDQSIDPVGPIQRYYHEAEVDRLSRIISRLFWALVATIVLLVGTNAGWIWYESQFEGTVVTQDVDTGTGAAYVTGVGDINGESTSNGENPTP